MKIYLLKGYDCQGDCGMPGLTYITKIFKTREEAEEYVNTCIRDVRDYLQYYHEGCGFRYEDEIHNKNGNFDYFIARAKYDLADPKQHEAFLSSPYLAEAGLNNENMKVSICIDYDKDSFRSKDDNTITQTVSVFSISEIEI